jgi:Cft2 family RNA processing exonuclease
MAQSIYNFQFLFLQQGNGDQMIQSNNLRISLDRKEINSDVDFVSHAHTDHLGAVRSSKNILASAQTLQLIEQGQNLTIHNRADSKNFRLIEAGHMLGSRQLCVDDCIRGNRITYTGDFQTVKSRTSNPIDIVNTDTLIMDSTYAEKFVSFEDKYEVESKIQDWTLRMLKSGIVVFSTYAMGKAQELISILNNIGIKPVVSRKIDKVSSVYVDNGVNLDYSSAYRGQSDYDSIIKENFVGITETRNLAALKYGLELAHNKTVYTAVATGFAKIFRFNVDGQFPLSDHADFEQSVEYIEATGAKKVLTYGPNAASFAKNLSKEGYDSIPFNESPLDSRNIKRND